MLEFAVEVCNLQRRAGRGLILEHPVAASSWEACADLKKLVAQADVMTTVFDMCQFGMVSKDSEGEGLVRKATKVATNAPELADVLDRRCGSGHRHVLLVNGRAKAAAIYPEKLCEAVCSGLERWMERLGNGGVPIMEFSRPDLCDPEEIETQASSGYFLDDVQGELLDPSSLGRHAWTK